MNILRSVTLLAGVTALSMGPVPGTLAQSVTDFEDDFEVPELEEPEVEEPEIEEPEIAEPEVEEPEVEEPEVEEPEVEEPEVEEPEVDAPEVEDSEVEEPEVEEPEVEEPEAEDPEVEEPEVEGSEDEAAETGENAGEEDATEGASSASADETISALAESDWIADIMQTQDPEFDEQGFPIERGELFALDLSETARATLLAQGFTVADATNLQGLDATLTTLTVPPGLSASQALLVARQVDPDGIYDFGHFYGSPFDTAGRQERARAPARPTGTARRGHLRVGLIDTHVRAGAIPSQVAVTSRAFGTQDASLASDHGTAVASILVHQGAGELVVANVFDSGQRTSFTSAGEISRALSWMLENRVSVVNVSLTGPRNAVLDTLVARAIGRGAVIVAAAGNGGPVAPPAYPAALPGVVAVTAVDASHRVYRYANRGDYVRLASYGVRIPVALEDGTTHYFTGTSFAAPRVASRIAGCMADGSSAASCITRVERSAADLGEPGWDEIYGYGLVE